jgi:cystathionine beta-synthase
MNNVHDSIASCVGGTPAVRLHRVTAGLLATLYAKLEYMNPGGSMKDRVALALIEEAETSGRLRPGGTIIDATSGDMGIGLAQLAVVRGYRTIFVMSDKQSEEKRAILRAYGARVVITPSVVGRDDPRSHHAVARRLAEETPNSVFINQYGNAANPETHYRVTGPELYEQFDGNIDVLVAGMGSGGAISGIGRYLKEKKPDVKIVGVDPVGSVFYDYFHTGQVTDPNAYQVEGLGVDFLPQTLDFSFVDDVLRVNDKDCFLTTRRLVREEGLFAGGSAGATLAGALKYLKLHDREGLCAVVLLTDTGTRYLSKIFNDTWMRENGFLDPDPSLGTVRELLVQMGPQEIVTVDASVRVPEVIGRLKLHGISQVPVLRDGRLAGILTENRLLERALRGGSQDTEAGDLVEANYCTVDPDTDLSVVLDLFRRAKVAIVLEDGQPKNIITRIDLIDHISKVTSSNRE